MPLTPLVTGLHRTGAKIAKQRKNTGVSPGVFYRSEVTNVAIELLVVRVLIA